MLHHKLWLDEMDQQPPLLSMNDTGYATSVAKSIANVQRNMLYTFTHGTGFWFTISALPGFNGGPRLNDHGSFGWWDEPSLMKAIGNDLEKADPVQYKTIVFINTWVLSDKQKKLIKEKIAKGNRSLVWLYAPGYCSEKELGKKFIEEVTGFSLQQIKLQGAATLTEDSSITSNNRFTVWNNTVEPLFAVSDAGAVSYGKIEKANASGLAVKS